MLDDETMTAPEDLRSPETESALVDVSYVPGVVVSEEGRAVVVH